MQDGFALCALAPANPLGLWLATRMGEVGLKQEALIEALARRGARRVGRNNLSHYCDPDKRGVSFVTGTGQVLMEELMADRRFLGGRARAFRAAAPFLSLYSMADKGAEDPQALFRSLLPGMTRRTYLALYEIFVEGVMGPLEGHRVVKRRKYRPASAGVAAELIRARRELTDKMARQLVEIDDDPRREVRHADGSLDDAASVVDGEVRRLARMGRSAEALRRVLNRYQNSLGPVEAA